MAIIISEEGKNAKKIEKSTIEAEDYLQKYIYDNPESLPLYDIKEDIRLLILAREFPTNSGPVDALGIDKDGEIYVIETKLYKNPDKRLVLAQVLDYGAALWRGYNNFNDFLKAIDDKVQAQFNTNVNHKLEDFFDITDDDVATLLSNTESNLKDGSFRFVVLMDRLSDRLKDMIIFINQNSTFDIFGVEMEYYKFNEYEIMIPRLFGSEVKGKTPTGTRRKWDEKSFFDDAEKKKKMKDAELKAIKTLYDFSVQHADEIAWGTGATYGSFNPKFAKMSTRSLYTVYSNGTLQLNFSFLHDSETAKKYRDKFLERLEGLLISDASADDRVRVPIQEWRPKLTDFIKVVQDLVGQ